MVRFQSFVTGGNRPILLKKAAMICAIEKHASETEIFTFGRGFRTRISRSSVKKDGFTRLFLFLFKAASRDNSGKERLNLEKRYHW